MCFAHHVCRSLGVPLQVHRRKVAPTFIRDFPSEDVLGTCVHSLFATAATAASLLPVRVE